MEQTPREITIRVLDRDRHELVDARILIASERDGTITATYDSEARLYRATIMDDGRVTVTVSQNGFEEQQRSIAGARLPLTVDFMLGRLGDAYLWLHGVRVPYTPYPNEIAVIAHEGWEPEGDELGTSKSRRSASDVASKNFESGAMKTFFVTHEADESGQANGRRSLAASDRIERLRAESEVVHAGRIFRKHENDADIITDTIQVRFWNDVREFDALEILKALKVGRIALVPGTSRTYTADATTESDIERILTELMSRPEVESATALLLGPIRVDVTPNDFLWPILWDRQLMQCPDAWGFLQTNAGGKEFGDPQITLAVLDAGTKTTGQGNPAHEDLQGGVSGYQSDSLIGDVNPTRSQLQVLNPAGFNTGDVIDAGLDLGKEIYNITPTGPGNQAVLEIDALLIDVPSASSVRLHNESGVVNPPRTLTAFDTPAETAVIAIHNASNFNVGDRITIGSQNWSTFRAVSEEVVVLARDLTNNRLTTTPVVARNPDGINAQHPDTTIVERGRKVVLSFDDTRTAGGVAGKYDHDTDASSDYMVKNHGLLCATLAVAKANNASATAANVGVVGVAPDVRLLALRSREVVTSYRAMLSWAAGLLPYPVSNQHTGWPNQLQIGAEVISCSKPIGEDGDTANARNADVNEFIDQLVRRGRKGRGLPFFMSSGNSNMAQELSRWSTHPKVFAIGAVSLSYDGTDTHESRSLYSNYTNSAGYAIGQDGWVAVSAPSDYDANNRMTLNPPSGYFSIGGVIPGSGNRIGSSTSTTTLVNGTPVAKRSVMLLTKTALDTDSEITVDNVDSVHANDWLLIGAFEDPTKLKWVKVLSVLGKKITLTAQLGHVYPAVVRDRMPFTAQIVQVSNVAARKIVVNIPWSDHDLYVTVNSIVAIRSAPYIVSGVASSGTNTELTLMQNLAPAITSGDPVTTSAVANARVIGATTITVANASPFVGASWIQLGDPAPTGSESVFVRTVDPVANTIEIAGPLNNYNPTASSPVNIYLGNLDYWDRFGGTSAATPLAAGTAALILTAKPTLSWVEVREVFRESSVPIDLTCHDVRPALGAAGQWAASPQVDGRWINVDGIPIVDAGGDLVLLSDDPDISANPSTKTLTLNSILAMYPGHAVMVQNVGASVSERRIIAAVDTGTRTITLTQSLTHSYPSGKVITGMTTATAHKDPGATVLQVASTAPFVAGQAIRIDGSEVRVIRSITDDTHMVIDPLVGSVDNGDEIEGGHIPWRNRFYGFGRIDAAVAVQKAHAYNHATRDLWIRNNLADDGVTAIVDLVAHPIDSPDIWGRIDAAGSGGVPVAADVRALPEGYRVPGYDQKASYTNPAPNQRPVPGQDYHIYARIENRGVTVPAAGGNPEQPALPGLQAWARVYIYRTKADGYFRIPKQWNDARPANEIPDTVVGGVVQRYGPSGVFFVAPERPLHDAAVVDELPALVGGILPQEHFIVKATWNAADLPSTNNPPIEHRLRTHIVVEVTPYDGELAGETLGQNNNISSREISFAQVQFKQGDGSALPDQIRVSRNGTSTALNFKIDIADQIGFFNVSMVKVIGTRTTSAGTSESAEFTWTGPTTWARNPSGATWFSVDPPKVGAVAAVASNDEFNLNFTGTVSASILHDNVEIKLVIESSNGVVLVEEIAALPVEATPVTFSDLDVGEPNEPSIYTFADMAGLTHTTAFGPIDTLKFQVTSAFTAAAGTKAYAVAAGELMIQRVNDGASLSATRVNVIIRPFNAPRIGTRAVKYFVYRGLRLTDFLDSAVNEADVHNRAEKSEFLTYVYKVQKLRHDAFLATTYGTAHPTEAPPLTLKSAALGWDPTVTGATALDPSFFGDDNAPQLPIVPAGMQIGEFETGADCGFEVVLETNETPLTYDFARLMSNVIDVSADTAGTIDERHHREEIHRYVDPAAYYGHLFGIGVFARDGSNRVVKKEGAIYTDVISRFLSKNRIYVDIRNESDLSLDFYRNYAVGGFHLKYGSVAGRSSGKPYPTKQWPIFILERAAPERASGKIFLALSMKENPNPAVYVEEGTPTTKTTGGDFVVDGDLFATGQPWTKEVGLAINQQTVSGAKQDVATMLIIDYARRANPARVWPTPSPIVKFSEYTDSVFGPLNGLPSYSAPPGGGTRWRRLNDLRLIDGTDNDPALGFGSIAERGVAYQTGQVMFFCSALDYFKRNPGTPKITVGTGLEGGFAPQPNLFAASMLFSRFDVKTVQIQEPAVGGGAPTIINAVHLTPVVSDAASEGILLLGLGGAEYDALITAAGGLSDSHPKDIVLREDLPPGQTHQSDGTTLYHRYFVELRGLDASGNSADAVPAAPIVVYSVDGLAFVSTAFDATKLIPDVYTPDHEEERALGKPEPEDRIKVDSIMAEQITLFGNAINQVQEGSPTPVATLETAVTQYAATIFEQAWTFTLTPTPGDVYPDDRPLYWTRLRMAVALKGHPVLRKNGAERDRLTREFEWLSRGMREDLFDVGETRKKILICGTDPMGLNDQIIASNPSAVAALDLHGEEIAVTGVTSGIVKSVILPLRYRDYDARLVEEFFTRYLFTEPVHMILVLSQNGAFGWFDLDRFAARNRGKVRDNNDQFGLTPIGAGAGWNEFYPTGLPVNQIMAGRKSEAPQILYYDQSYKQVIGTGSPAGPDHPRNGGSNEEHDDPAITLAGITGTADAGSAGSFIPNEIFYRLMHLEANPPAGASTSTKIGHMSMPTPTASGISMSQLVEQIRTVLKKSLPQL